MKKHFANSFLNSLLFLVVFWGGSEARLFAQLEKPKPLFQTYFPNPTGKNGYEEWIRAADLLSPHEDWVRLFGELNSPLSKVRSALREPDARTIIDLIRSGAEKPILPLRDPTKIDFSTSFPEYARLRNLARMLNNAIYVALAEGRNYEAIDLLRVGLIMGYKIQQEALIAGLVGVAIEDILIRRFRDTLPTLSMQDCDELERLALLMANAPSPLSNLIAQEKVGMTNSLKSIKSAKDVQEAFGGEPDEPNQLTKEIERYGKANPSAIETLMQNTLKEMDRKFATIVANANLPAWQRTPLPPFSNTLAGTLAEMLIPPWENVFKRYDDRRGNLQILGLRAALRRYWWQNGRFPKTLEALNVGDRILEPKTGKPFSYTLKENGYDLVVTK
jgi:hypothetical protein